MKIIFPEIYPVACHTDHIGPSSTYVAIKGQLANGAQYIELALKKGAKKIIAQEQLSEQMVEHVHRAGAVLEYVDDARLALAIESARMLDYPAKKLKIIAITGTKGKSTTTYIAEHMLRSAGYKTARLCTIANKILDTEFESTLTTAHPDYLHVFFDLCVKNGVEYVVMEVAAQALSLHRIEGLEFEAVVFTNFSAEHGEFYPTIEEYFKAKHAIFDHLKPMGIAILNADDERVIALQNVLTSTICAYGIEQNMHAPDLSNDVRRNHGTKKIEMMASIAEYQSSIKLHVRLSSQQSKAILAPYLIGEFNAYNVLAAISVALTMGVSIDQCAQALLVFKGVKGRLHMQTLKNGAIAVIDHAHTPSSFDAILKTVRSLRHHVITVFGCGGDRDRAKRPIMAELAVRYSDIVIITSDNPRFEDPEQITQDMLAGIAPDLLSKVIIEPDRACALEYAARLTSNESIIAVLGKGSDEYQLVQGVKTYFSEAALLSKL